MLDNKNIFENKNILIIGGTGTFGNKILEKLIKLNCKNLYVYSRDEYKQFIMKKKFPDIKYIIGDIRDYNRLLESSKNIDILFHAAAMKQIDTVENNPLEAIKTNIYGTENVIKVAINNNIDKVISISTDKCVEPTNLYGASKMCLEKLIISGNKLSDKTKFSVLRYGNVTSSRGSVIPLFLEQKKNNIFTVTDTNMTRFNITAEKAIDFTLNCVMYMIGGEIFIPKLKSFKITQLTEVINSKAQLKIIGIRPGEKLHEKLISEQESSRTLVFNDIYIILPEIFIKSRINYENIYGNIYRKKIEYNSFDNEYITNKELSNLINNSF